MSSTFFIVLLYGHAGASYVAAAPAAAAQPGAEEQAAMSLGELLGKWLSLETGGSIVVTTTGFKA